MTLVAFTSVALLVWLGLVSALPNYFLVFATRTFNAFRPATLTYLFEALGVAEEIMKLQHVDGVL